MIEKLLHKVIYGPQGPFNTLLNAMRDIETIFREIENVPDFTGHNIDSVKYTNDYGDTPLHIV
jgi:hypothetical protein